MIRRHGLLLVLVAPLLILAQTGHAERAWIKDELRLNIRTGAGVQYRIVGVLKTGDSVEILSRGEDWTRVRAHGGMEGWIPAGYLQAEAPARIRLERHEADTSALRERFEKISAEVEELRGRNEQLSKQESSQQSEMQRLTRENLELRAGARWPEWVAGASILFVGSILGIIVHRSSTRRPGPRIRL
jgi:SH3 domain protein